MIVLISLVKSPVILTKLDRSDFSNNTMRDRLIYFLFNIDGIDTYL
jgi:hypothetical protein